MRFTEDTVELAVGKGLWKTATRVRPYRLDVVDVSQGVVGTHTIVEEGDQPAMYQVRLGIEGREITEIADSGRA